MSIGAGLVLCWLLRWRSGLLIFQILLKPFPGFYVYLVMRKVAGKMLVVVKALYRHGVKAILLGGF